MASTTSRIKLPKSLVVIALLASGVILSAAWPSPPIETFDETSGVSDALLALGDDKPLHYTPNRDTALTRMGFEIITEGRTKGPDGKMGRRQSKYFTCTHCHNVEREDPDLKISDPDARLGYTSKNGLPFLQGTTLWGIVNRESWYNDDYLLKYGDLVADSRDTLYNAIHLCAVECSQGRPLEDWELEAVMTYLYSIEITLGDLGFTDDQYTELHQIVAGGTDQKKKDAIGWIKQQFMTKSPATFMYPQSVDHRKLGANGDPTNGALVYETSCQHCHSPGGSDQLRIG